MRLRRKTKYENELHSSRRVTLRLKAGGNKQLGIHCVRTEQCSVPTGKSWFRRSWATGWFLNHGLNRIIRDFADFFWWCRLRRVDTTWDGGSE